MANPANILHIEDDDVHATYVQAVLDTITPGEFRLTRTSSLRSGLAFMSDTTFDAVILDLSLPDAAGFRALEELTAVAGSTPVLVFSARDDDATLLASLEHRAAESLVKGRDEPEALPRALRSALRRSARAEARPPSWSPDVDASAVPADRLVADFVEAMKASDQLVLLYQPKVDLATGRVTSAEALIRWHHPELGHLRPDVFIPAIEASDAAIDLTRWTIGRALADRRRWAERGRTTTVAVNVPGPVLAEPDLDVLVAAALNEHGADPTALVLELTETAVISDAARAVLALTRLDNMGVATSIDDFGAGHGSLTYLSRFPVREVKIDRQFVTSMTVSPRDAAIVEATLDLAQSLGLTTVAEGIESSDVAERLQALRCTSGQGYLWWPALPAEELFAVLGSSTPVITPLAHPLLDFDDAVDRRATSVMARALRRLLRADTPGEVMAIIGDAVVDLGATVGSPGSPGAVEIDISLGRCAPSVPIAPDDPLVRRRILETIPSLMEDAQFCLAQLDRLDHLANSLTGRVG